MNRSGSTTRLAGGGERRSTSSVIVGFGLLAISALSAGQALVIAFIAHGGPGTDAFFAAYAIYVPLATVGLALRASLVPLLGGERRDESFAARAGELIGRTWLVGATAAAVLLALSWPLAEWITDAGSGDSAPRTALLTLLVLLPAATLQILAGSASAVLAALRRFRFSIGMYVAAGGVALATSAALLLAVGIVGAALGLATGAVILAGAHAAYLRRLGIRMRARVAWIADRGQAELAWVLFAGVALSMSQQIGFAMALATVSDSPGSVTQYAYAYYVTGLLLNLSVLPLAIVTLPDLVDEMRSGASEASRRYMLTMAPYVAFLLAPALVAFVAFSEPLLRLMFDSGLGEHGVSVMYETASTLTLAMVAISVFTLGAAILAAQRRWSLAAGVAAASVLIYAIALTLFAGKPDSVAIGHAVAAACSAAMLLAVIFGRETLRMLGALAWRCSPALALSLPIVAGRLLLGDDPTAAEAALGATLGLGVYLILALVLWRSVAGRLLALVRRLLAGRQREAAS
jgi:O-antigen/teichoic acid export membrane protein